MLKSSTNNFDYADEAYIATASQIYLFDASVEQYQASSSDWECSKNQVGIQYSQMIIMMPCEND